MANTRALKARIASAEGIRQITKSMKMVSASKLRRVQAARERLDPMARESRRLLAKVLAGAGPAGEPLLEDRPEKKKVCYVLLVGNRGLCGVYNTALVKFLEERLKQEQRAHSLVVCGSWGQDVLEGEREVLRRFDRIGDVPEAGEAGELSAYLTQLYLSGEADEIVFLYQRFDSFLKQTPCAFTLLPLQAEECAGTRADYLFEPDRASLVGALARLALDSTVFSLLLEARNGEHAARMASMTSAADNTEELIAKLTLALNHARQAAITTEISEIAGGAEALNGGRT